MRAILSKEPWWARPPHPGQDENELEWGWLVHYSEGEPRFEFVRERPTDEQIRNRKSCRITPLCRVNTVPVGVSLLAMASAHSMLH
jgi:hypothetical protein